MSRQGYRKNQGKNGWKTHDLEDSFQARGWLHANEGVIAVWRSRQQQS